MHLAEPAPPTENPNHAADAPRATCGPGHCHDLGRAHANLGARDKSSEPIYRAARPLTIGARKFEPGSRRPRREGQSHDERSAGADIASIGIATQTAPTRDTLSQPRAEIARNDVVACMTSPPPRARMVRQNSRGHSKCNVAPSMIPVDECGHVTSWPVEGAARSAPRGVNASQIISPTMPTSASPH